MFKRPNLNYKLNKNLNLKEKVNLINGPRMFYFKNIKIFYGHKNLAICVPTKPSIKINSKSKMY